MRPKRLLQSIGCTLAGAVIAGAVLPASAGATWPGTNGRIAFAQSPDEDGIIGGSLSTMSFTGTDERLVTATGAQDSSEPAWSPSGRRIAYAATPTGRYDGGPYEIFKIWSDGSGKQRLTWTSGRESSPTWSPDGTRIAFAYDPGPRGYSTTSEIWVMRSDGTNRRRLSAPGARDFHPVWSPGGYRIAFHSDRSGNYEIYNMAIDGTDVRRVTRDTDVDYHATFAPTGNRLVWTSGGDIQEANALDGSAAVMRTDTPDVYEYQPVVSPNGNWIAYSRGINGGYLWQIWRIRRDGSDPRPLGRSGISPDWQRVP